MATTITAQDDPEKVDLGSEILNFDYDITSNLISGLYFSHGSNESVWIYSGNSTRLNITSEDQIKNINFDDLQYSENAKIILTGEFGAFKSGDDYYVFKIVNPKSRIHDKTDLIDGVEYQAWQIPSFVLPTYTLSSTDSVNEGGSAVFSLTPTNSAAVNAGSKEIKYSIVNGSGSDAVTETDFTNNLLSGSFFTQEDGAATFSIEIAADYKTEGDEAFSVILDDYNILQSVSIIDTSVEETENKPEITVSTGDVIINEGGWAAIRFTTKNIPFNSTINAKFSGTAVVTDWEYASQTGNFYYYDPENKTGYVSFQFNAIADTETEGEETYNITPYYEYYSNGGLILDSRIFGPSKNITVADLSITPTYIISSTVDQLNEGSAVEFTVISNAKVGAVFDYKISGINSTDTSASLYGTATVSATGPTKSATISIPILADLATEGAEVLTLSVIEYQEKSDGIDSYLVNEAILTKHSVLINDTSLGNPSYSLSATNTKVNEGDLAQFLLVTTNVVAGTMVSYALSGVTEKDIVGDSLYGTTNIGLDGTATISIGISSDLLTEGIETLTLTLEDQTASVSITDLSTAIPITRHDRSVRNDYSNIITTLSDFTVITGDDTNNIVVGTVGNDSMVGAIGNDRFFSSQGNDSVDGGAGKDAFTFTGMRSDYQLTVVGENIISKDMRSDALINEGTQTFASVERLGFSDMALAFDVDGGAGEAYRIYKAAFDRAPDTGGLGYWIGRIDDGLSMVDVAARFIDSDEFKELYGADPSDREYITKVYSNVLGRSPDTEGYAWWLDQLANNPEKTRQKVLADFSESSENKENLIDLIGTGISYSPYIEILDAA